MDGVQPYDEELTTYIKRLTGVVEELKRNPKMAPEKKRKCVDDASRLQKQIVVCRRGFNLGLRGLSDKNTKQTYRVKLTRHDQRAKALANELNWHKTQVNQGDLMRGRKNEKVSKADPNRMDEDQMLSATKNSTQATIESLKNTARMGEETKDVGLKASAQLDEQTDKLGKIHQDLTDIQSSLVRSRALIRSFTRRMMTDKLILMFLGLILIGLVAIVIIAMVDDNSGIDVPEDVKPPSPPDSRMLRGIDF
eukprot:TRINITY_DN780130_c0_g1_i1.p1 TRINITY_DN780130_c0_g1~~TRINITY_DN780130_c0_g1_i1.p1  ORF type:complete len:251 (-),score=66.21 TRINITY_DN780130_c0_g1_i1:282-1034(-)